MNENKDLTINESMPDNVPYIVFEGELARMESVYKEEAERREKTHKDIVKKLFTIIIVVFVAFVLSNAYWIWRDSQFIDEEWTITQENADGYNNFIGNDGDITYGETDSDKANSNTENWR